MSENLTDLTWEALKASEKAANPEEYAKIWEVYDAKREKLLASLPLPTSDPIVAAFEAAKGTLPTGRVTLEAKTIRSKRPRLRHIPYTMNLIDALIEEANDKPRGPGVWDPMHPSKGWTRTPVLPLVLRLSQDRYDELLSDMDKHCGTEKSKFGSSLFKQVNMYQGLEIEIVDGTGVIRVEEKMPKIEVKSDGTVTIDTEGAPLTVDAPIVLEDAEEVSEAKWEGMAEVKCPPETRCTTCYGPSIADDPTEETGLPTGEFSLDDLLKSVSEEESEPSLAAEVRSLILKTLKQKIESKTVYETSELIVIYQALGGRGW